MKSVLILAALLVMAAARSHSPRWCDLSNPVTAANNEYFLGTIAEEGAMWEQSVRVITPDYNPDIMNVQSYVFWQHNYANTERCAISSIEFNPRITADGEFALAIQEIDAHLTKPCRGRCRQPHLFSSGSSSSGSSSSSSSSSNGHQECKLNHPIEWITPYTAESLFVANTVPDNAVLHQKVLATAYKDLTTGALLLSESLNTIVPHKHRLYNLGILTEFVPGQPESTDFAALVTFNSNAVQPPPFVTAALQAYLAGEVPILLDPNSDPNYPTEVYLYIVPAAKRSVEDMDMFRRSAETLSRLARTA